MALSKREAALEALKSVIAAAVPGATVDRDDEMPDEIPAAGLVVVSDGDAGEPETSYSPYLETYEHVAEVSVAVAGLDLVVRLDALLQAIGAAIAANPTLGGAVTYAVCRAPDFNALALDGMGARGALVPVVLEYSVSGDNPLE